MTRTIVAALVLTAVALAVLHSNYAEALSPERTYMGPMENGGVIRLTVDPQKELLTRVEFLGAFGGKCAIKGQEVVLRGRDFVTYLDPPVSIANGNFFVGIRFGTPNNPWSYVVEGSVSSKGGFVGTARHRVGLVQLCGGQDLNWTADQPSSEPPANNDAKYVSESGAILVTTTPDGEGLTSIELRHFQGLECYGELDLKVFFEPPAVGWDGDDSFAAVPTSRPIGSDSRGLGGFSIGGKYEAAGSLVVTLQSGLPKFGGCVTSPIELTPVIFDQTTSPSPNKDLPSALPNSGSAETPNDHSRLQWIVVIAGLALSVLGATLWLRSPR